MDKQTTWGGMVAEAQKEQAAQQPIVNNSILPSTTPQAETIVAPQPTTNELVVQPAAVEPTVTPEENFSEFEIPSFDENTSQAQPQLTKPELKELLKDFTEDEIADFLGEDDFVKNLRRHAKNGGSYSDYVNTKAINWENVSDAEMIKSELKRENPDATPQQIDRIFNKKYSQTDLDEAEDKEDGLLFMKGDARKLRESKLAEQAKFKIAEPQKQVSNQPQINQAEIDARNQAVQKILTNPTVKNLFESKRVAVKVGDNLVHNLGVQNPEALMNIWLKPNTIAKVLQNPQGEPDGSKMAISALFLSNPEAYNKAIYEAGVRAGEARKLDESRNIGQQPRQVGAGGNVVTMTEAFKDAKLTKFGG